MKHVINQAVSINEDLELLCAMVFHNPNVRSCFLNVINSCLQNEFQATENGSRVKKGLMNKLRHPYSQFFRNAITNALSCGFVPFVIKKSDGIFIPHVLPLGTFKWSVEKTKPSAGYKSRDVAGLLWYRVTCDIEKINEDDIYVFPFEDPICRIRQQVLVTPMRGILQQARELMASIQKSIVCQQWNTSKHVVITEKCDIKDQTTSGLQLLDEQRRYYLTGHHNQLRHDNLLRLRNQDGLYQSTVAEGMFSHVRQEFDDYDDHAPGSKRACCHIMPPNVEVTELGPLQDDTDITAIQERFTRDVFTFFNVNNNKLSGISKSTVASVESMDEAEHRQHVQMCRFLERIGAYAYAKCFKVDYVNVQFTLQPVSKHDQEDPEYMKSTAEVEKSKTEQEVMKAQVSKTQAETSKTKAEIGKTKAEADKTSADAQAIRSGKKQKTAP